MAEGRVQRRLSAILATDVVGYSRHVRADEEGAVAALKALRADIFDPKIAENNGRVVKLMGDGMLVEFPSVVDAVRTAAEVQRVLAERNATEPVDRRIEFRIGVNLGDVIIDDDDIQGDGVNIASRLEGLADPGGICIAGAVYEQVRDRLDLDFEDLGEQAVKNIDRPVRVWRWSARVTTPDEPAARDRSDLALPDKPSVAVLPFTYMSGNPDEDFLGDGLAEDIITGLSRIRSFFVIARNSTFQYKGTSPDVRRVATDLGVRYVVEGSVRKAGNRIRATVQLIDGRNGNHLWADRLDRDIEDIFAIQDEITGAIVAQLEPELSRAEYERVRLLPPDNLDAWELYHRAIARYQEWTPEANLEARQLFEKAVERDRNFAPAYAGVAYTHEQDWFFRGREANLAAALEFARRAVVLDDKDAFGHVALSRAYHLNNDAAAARAECATALRLNPSSAPAHFIMGLIHLHLEAAAEAVSFMEQGIRLSPFDPEKPIFESRLGGANFCAGNYDVAISMARNSLRTWIHWLSQTYLVASLGHLDRLEEARRERDKLEKLKQGFTVDFARNNWPPWHPVYVERVLDGLRKAGVPE